MTALEPSMVIVARESHGRWSATFTIDTDALEPLGKTGCAVGVDPGVRDLAVTSEGQRIANPRHLEHKARALARYQRRLARCQKGSANRAEAAAKVAGAHRKVRRARADFLHRASTRLVRTALSLSTRQRRCPSCGAARHDRDLNAAKNIRAAGGAVARGSSGDACGAEVRHSGSSRVCSAAKQETRPARAGSRSFRSGSSQDR